MENTELIESLEYHIQEFAKRGRPWDGHFKMTPEQKKEYQKKWREAHKDYHKKYYQDHKSNFTDKSSNKTNRKKSYTPDDWDSDLRPPLRRSDAPDVYDAWDEYNR